MGKTQVQNVLVYRNMTTDYDRLDFFFEFFKALSPLSPRYTDCDDWCNHIIP